MRFGLSRPRTRRAGKENGVYEQDQFYRYEQHGPSALSLADRWALSVGSAIGWGSLVVTSRTYLSQAGPMGSILGLLIGLVMMLMVANHYHFLANRYPGTGGLYNYVKYIFGYDRAFLAAWFMFLIYISIF